MSRPDHAKLVSLVTLLSTSLCHAGEPQSSSDMLTSIAFDIGGVLVDGRRQIDGSQIDIFKNNDLKNAMHVSPIDGAFDIVRDMVELLGTDNVVIISKSNVVGALKKLLWLRFHNFFQQTGFVPKNIHFVRERHEKTPLAHELLVAGMIDDKLEVLSRMDHDIPSYHPPIKILFGNHVQNGISQADHRLRLPGDTIKTKEGLPLPAPVLVHHIPNWNREHRAWLVGHVRSTLGL